MFGQTGCIVTEKNIDQLIKNMSYIGRVKVNASFLNNNRKITFKLKCDLFNF